MRIEEAREVTLAELKVLEVGSFVLVLEDAPASSGHTFEVSKAVALQLAPRVGCRLLVRRILQDELSLQDEGSTEFQQLLAERNMYKLSNERLLGRWKAFNAAVLQGQEVLRQIGSAVSVCAADHIDDVRRGIGAP